MSASGVQGKEETMKSHTHYLTMHTAEKTAYVNITPQVADCIRDEGGRLA
jgi:hypothetical protein